MINQFMQRKELLMGKKAKEVKMRENKIYHFIIVRKELLQLAVNKLIFIIFKNSYKPK